MVATSQPFRKTWFRRMHHQAQRLGPPVRCRLVWTIAAAVLATILLLGSSTPSNGPRCAETRPLLAGPDRPHLCTWKSGLDELGWDAAVKKAGDSTPDLMLVEHNHSLGGVTCPVCGSVGLTVAFNPANPRCVWHTAP